MNCPVKQGTSSSGFGSVCVVSFTPKNRYYSNIFQKIIQIYDSTKIDIIFILNSGCKNTGYKENICSKCSCNLAIPVV